MMSAQKIKTVGLRAFRRGFTLIEAAVAIAMTGILIVSFLSVFEVSLALFRRTRIHEMQALQVDPVKAIIQTHVRECRYALYRTLAEAKAETAAGLVKQAASKGSTDFALRCTRRDGNGVFILHWAGPTASTDGTLYLVTGVAPGTNPGNQWNTPIPLTRALSVFTIDTSQGFCQATALVPAPLDPFSRSTGTVGQSSIGYTFFAESNL